MKNKSTIVGIAFISLLMFNVGYFSNEFLSEEEVILEQSKDLNLLDVLNYQPEIIENESVDETPVEIIMAKEIKKKTERKFKPAPKEDPNFKVGYKVKDSTGRIGIVVGVDRGPGPSAEKVFVEFDGKPENILKSDCEVIERKEHQW